MFFSQTFLKSWGNFLISHNFNAWIQWQLIFPAIQFWFGSYVEEFDLNSCYFCLPKMNILKSSVVQWGKISARVVLSGGVASFIDLLLASYLEFLQERKIKSSFFHANFTMMLKCCEGCFMSVLFLECTKSWFCLIIPNTFLT